jgi:hypothetical protein
MKRRGKQETNFAMCVYNKGYEASLEAGKLYRVIHDDEVGSHGYLRVIDVYDLQENLYSSPLLIRD